MRFSPIPYIKEFFSFKSTEPASSDIAVPTPNITDTLVKEAPSKSLKKTNPLERSPLYKELFSSVQKQTTKLVKKIDKDELVKDATYLRNSICVELVSEKLGEKQAREYAVLHDPQVSVAEQIIKNGGKISAQLMAKYPKKKDTEIAGEKKLEQERAKHKSSDSDDDK